jgi:AraC-like DNA-binding protein
MRNGHESRSAIRRHWLDAVVAASQQIAGEAHLIEPDDAHEMLQGFVQPLPSPLSVVERLLMRAVLLDVAWRCGRTIHARAHRGHPGRCPFVPTTCLDRFWRAPVHDPEKAFLIWAEGFSTEFRRLHPATTASRVARWIRHDYERPWSLATLGRRFHVTPSQLRRSFEREFGVSIRAYQQTVRVSAALARVRTEKMEATALEVGYKGKKNFYRAFKQVTGLTPAAFRRLSEERAFHVVHQVGTIPPRKQVAADRMRRMP